MKSVRTIGLAAALVSMLDASVAEASYPAGVWVKVQGVQFEPTASAPTRIRIHGAAMLYVGGTAVSYVDSYSAPARGVLYYECPAAQLATCRNEWTDIVANIDAPPEVCIGLGDQSLPTGRLRRLEEAPGTADAYPIQMGILSGLTPCQMIREFLSGETDAGGAGGAGVSGAGSGGSGTQGTGSGGTGGAGGTSAGGSSPGSGSAGSNAGTSSGQGGASASALPSDTSEERGCSVTAIPIASGASAAALAALAALALRRRRRG